MNVGPAAYVNLTSDGAVKSGPGQLVGVALAAGSDAATVILYDNTTGSGTVICKLAAATGTSEAFCPCVPVSFQTGCYAVMTGTAESVSAAYL